MSGPTAGNIPAEGLCLLRVEFEREYEGHTLQKVLKEEAKGDFEKALSSLASYTPPPGVKEEAKGDFEKLDSSCYSYGRGHALKALPFLARVGNIPHDDASDWLAWGIFRTLTPPIGSRYAGETGRHRHQRARAQVEFGSGHFRSERHAPDPHTP
eukprot:964835-Prorocentrum_minimum.AAC.1